MIRVWLMIAMTTLGGELQWRADRLGHLTTDPLCSEFRAPRLGSRLDKSSRGLACGECMLRRAFSGPGLDEFTRPRGCTCGGRGRPCFECSEAGES